MKETMGVEPVGNRVLCGFPGMAASIVYVSARHPSADYSVHARDVGSSDTT